MAKEPSAHLRPYEALFDNLTMYDKLPYDRDLSLCGPEAIAMESGNILKYFRCTISDPVPIDNKDQIMMEKLTSLQTQGRIAPQALDYQGQEDDEDDPILSEDEVAGLFEEGGQFYEEDDDTLTSM